jgi:hypothetical protein
MRRLLKLPQIFRQPGACGRQWLFRRRDKSCGPRTPLGYR